MKGTTIECLRHYLGTLPKHQKNIREARQPFCDAVKCTHKAATSWAAGVGRPIALQLILARVFLQKHGYGVIEVENLDALMLRCTHALAEGVTTSEHLLEVLRYPHVREVYRVLRGDAMPSRDKMERLKAHLDEVFPEASVPSPKVMAPRAEDFILSATLARSVDHSSARRVRVSAPERVTADVFQHQVLALLALAKHFVSDDVSDENRAQLRARFSRNEIFELSNALGALCTKTARNDYMEDRHGK